MKYLILLTVLVCSISWNTYAQDCSKDIALVNSLFEKLNLEQAINDPSAITAEFDNLKNSLGSVSLMSLKKDAPKLLFLNNKAKKGNAKAGKKRVFVTSLIQKEEFRIEYNNLNTAVGAEIVICSHSKNGKTENIEKVTIPAASEAIQNFTISGQRGKIVSITLKNNSKKDKLEFRLKGSYL